MTEPESAVSLARAIFDDAYWRNQTTADTHVRAVRLARLVLAEAEPEPAVSERCICPRFRDSGGFRIADLCCPTHGVRGTDPSDGFWDDKETP